MVSLPKLLTGFVLLLALVLAQDHHSHTFPGSIRQINPDSSGLTVTSFRYNPTSILNEWFSSIFGNDSVWYNVSQQSPSWMSGPSHLGVEKMEALRLHGHRLVRERLQNIPDFSKKPPPCSIEILAYGRVDLNPPMMRGWRDLGPIAGLGSLRWERKDKENHATAAATASDSLPATVSIAGAGSGPGSGFVTVKCYWRALFENWRKQNAWTSPNFWAMIFFCPLGQQGHGPGAHSASAGVGHAGGATTAGRRLQELQQADLLSSNAAGQSPGPGSGSGQLQCMHLERSHVSDNDGGVVGFNLTAQLLSSHWSTSFEGRLYPSGSPTANILHTRHRAESHTHHAARHEKRIHKYSSSSSSVGVRHRRLDAAAAAAAEGEGGSIPSPTTMLQRLAAEEKEEEEKKKKKNKNGNGKAAAAADNDKSSDSDSTTDSSTVDQVPIPNIYLAEAQAQADLLSHKMAICAIIPYSSNDPLKARANGQMLLEWIHYHGKLGLEVFVYDRDGANARVVADLDLRKALFGAEEGGESAGGPRGSEAGASSSFSHLHYFNYTVRGLLDKTRTGLLYDNTERKPGKGWGESSSANTLRARYEAQGHDKVNTFTHCRFEAKALFGIDRVLTVDFDEFFYCPTAPPNPKALVEYQRERTLAKDKNYKLPRAEGRLTATARDLGRYINTVTATLQASGLRQIMFQQRVTMNKTASTRDCVVDMASRNPPRSVFNCFGSHKFERASHSTKSFHLGTTCPLTGYHQACPSPQVPRAYDCACLNFDSGARVKEWPYAVPPLATTMRCSLVHLATNQYVFV